jgi:hypothetical protein
MSASTVQTDVTNGSPLGYANALYSPGGVLSSGPVVLRSAGGEARLTEVDYGATGYPAQSVASLSVRSPPSTADTSLGAGVCVTTNDSLYAPSFQTYSGSLTLPRQPLGSVPVTVFYQWGEGQKYPGGPPIYPTPSLPGSAVNDLGTWALNIYGTVFSPNPGGGAVQLPNLTYMLSTSLISPTSGVASYISSSLIPGAIPVLTPVAGLTGYQVGVTQSPDGQLLVGWSTDDAGAVSSQVFNWSLTRIGGAPSPV